MVTPGRGLAIRPRLASLPATDLLIREPQASLAEVLALAERALEVGHRPWLHDGTPGARAEAERRGWPLHLPDRPQIVQSTTRFSVACHSAEAVDAAFAAGAWCCLLAPVWTPGSKPDDRRAPIGLAAYLAIAGERPVLALGGVDEARLAAILAAGGWGGAMIGAVWSQEPTTRPDKP